MSDLMCRESDCQARPHRLYEESHDFSPPSAAPRAATEPTAAQQERAKWRANERADRAEAREAALREAAQALLRFMPHRSPGTGTDGPFVAAADNLRALLSAWDKAEAPRTTPDGSVQEFAARHGIPLPEGLHLDSHLHDRRNP